MLKHIWSILCKESVIQDNNTLSIRDALENLIIGYKTDEDKDTLFPIDIPVNYEIVVCLYKDSKTVEKTNIKIEIIQPNGKFDKQLTQQVVVPAQSDRIRCRFIIQGMTIVQEGLYWFRISFEEKGKYKKVAELPLRVLLEKDGVIQSPTSK